MSKKKIIHKETIHKKTSSFSKVVILIVLINCILMMWASYWLAYIDKVQIAESLSQIVAGTVVVTCLGYFGKSTVENLSKNNNWPDKNESIKNAKNKILDKIINDPSIAEETTVEQIESGVLN